MLGGVIGLMLKLWSDTNRRLEHLEVSLRDEIRAVRADTSASIERLSDRQHADTNAVNARLDVLLLARGSLVGTPDAAQASGEHQPATAAEPGPEYRVPPRDGGGSDRP